ncbi:putative reverse transcriptase zinc-binding domain-containing protein [Arabidopsis thaliana]
MGKKYPFCSITGVPLALCLSCLGRRALEHCVSLSRLRLLTLALDVGWLISPPRTDQALALHIHLTTIALPCYDSSPDTFVWIVDDSTCHSFSAARTWEAMRPKKPVKDWTKSVWFKGSVPKHAFNMWVSHLNRLPTRQRFAAWGVTTTTDCCLCSSRPESIDHLLLYCVFSAVIWKLVFFRLTPSQAIFNSWAELLSWTRINSSKAPSLLRKIAAQASVFHLWKQRNNVLHNSIFISPATVFHFIDREVRNIITARRKRKRWRNLMIRWIR